jgi:predicted metal-dependent phosphoesterase TrpH
MERGYLTSQHQAFDRFLKSGRPAYVSEDWPALEKGVAAIIQAGGIAVMAAHHAVMIDEAKVQRLQLGAH